MGVHGGVVCSHAQYACSSLLCSKKSQAIARTTPLAMMTALAAEDRPSELDDTFKASARSTNLQCIMKAKKGCFSLIQKAEPVYYIFWWH
jgi:hypothetical protein